MNRPHRGWLIFAGVQTVAFAILLALSGRNTHGRRETLFWDLSHGEDSPAHRATALHGLLAAGNVEWRSARLHGLDLTGGFFPGAPLAAADFGGGDFRQAVFVEARLARARFHQAELAEADFTKADLTGAEFYRATLTGARFPNSKLERAGLQVARALRANFQGANLAGANLLMADCSGANFSGANLSAASLDGAILRGANLFLARLDGARLAETDFTDANWWQARGLSAAQTAELRRRFSPNAASPEALRAEFQAWTEGRGFGEPLSAPAPTPR